MTRIALLGIVLATGCSSVQALPPRCPAPSAAVSTRVVEQVDQFADNTALLRSFEPRCLTAVPAAQPTRHITAIRIRAASRLGYRLGVTDRIGASPQAHHNCYLVGRGEEVTVYFSTIYRPEALVIVPQNPSTGHVISEISSVVLPQEVTIGGQRVATRVHCHEFMGDMVACEHALENTTN